MYKKLHHFTSEEHLEGIKETGVILTTCSNLSSYKLVKGVIVMVPNHRDTNVVWFTDSETSDGMGLEGSSMDKKAIRITVNASDEFQYWDTWSQKKCIDKKWKMALTRNQKFTSWYVIERPVMFDEVVEIVNMHTGEVLYRK